MQHVVNKYHGAGGTKLVLIERGSSFGYNNLVSDMRSLPIMRAMGVPVIYDGVPHSVQMPGGQGTSSGGSGYLAPGMMRAAIGGVGCEGIFMEVHENPSQAKSDGPNMVHLDKLGTVLDQLMKIHHAIGRLQQRRRQNKAYGSSRRGSLQPTSREVHATKSSQFT